MDDRLYKCVDDEPLGNWHDTENKSGCYCVVCLICVKEEYFTDGVCGRCNFDDPCTYTVFNNKAKGQTINRACTRTGNGE